LQVEMQELIRFDKVNFSYGERVVLEGIDFIIRKGDFAGIIGPNGSGKTTLLRIVLKLLKPQSGDVTLFGKPAKYFNAWEKIGYVPQKVTQLESKFPITVEEAVALGRTSRLGLWRRFSARDAGAVDRVLSIMEIQKIRDRLITELSGGQQQRVFIAKALASEPELLILDEPTTGVDLESQDKFYDLLAKLNKEKGLTIILVSHDISVVVNAVSTLFCINRSLVYHGTPARFVQGEYLEKIYGKERKFLLHGH
jgi:zinc transport system ATP-binding protein